jgi:multisubunit Na+/H+ antiporter MnhF subunit
MDSRQGSYLPVAVVLALVSFISTSVVARFIEGRDE